MTVYHIISTLLNWCIKALERHEQKCARESLQAEERIAHLEGVVAQKVYEATRAAALRSRLQEIE